MNSSEEFILLSNYQSLHHTHINQRGTFYSIIALDFPERTNLGKFEYGHDSDVRVLAPTLITVV